MLKRSDLITQLKASVKTDSTRWEAGAFDTAIDDALRVMADVRPLTEIVDITLKAGTAFYSLPETVFKFIGTEWGLENTPKPWDGNFPGRLPKMLLVDRDNGKYLRFMPAPQQRHLNIYGPTFTCQYGILHTLTDDVCTIRTEDYDLLLLGGLVALMLQLVAANVSKPITLSRGMASIPNNATPLAAWTALKKAFKEKAVPNYA